MLAKERTSGSQWRDRSGFAPDSSAVADSMMSHLLRLLTHLGIRCTPASGQAAHPSGHPVHASIRAGCSDSRQRRNIASNVPARWVTLCRDDPGSGNWPAPETKGGSNGKETWASIGHHRDRGGRRSRTDGRTSERSFLLQTNLNERAAQGQAGSANWVSFHDLAFEFTGLCDAGIAILAEAGGVTVETLINGHGTMAGGTLRKGENSGTKSISHLDFDAIDAAFPAAAAACGG